MNGLFQLALLVIITASAAYSTWLLKGSPDEPPQVTCDSGKLKPDEICPQDVPGNVLWVDARSRAEWEKDRVNGAILWNLDASENQQAFEAEAAMRIADVNSDLVVVYCGTEACGTSREVAKRVRSLELGPDVKVVYGGWKAIKDSNPKP
jgi:rhodanese-related sulfurtransferase